MALPARAATCSVALRTHSASGTMARIATTNTTARGTALIAASTSDIGTSTSNARQSIDSLR